MSDMDIFYDTPPMGEAVVASILVPENGEIKSTDIELAGEAFIDNLNQEQFGTKVSPAGSGSSSDTFIVDFHAFRTILAVGLVNSSVTISEVYMWLGTNFFTSGSGGSINPNLLLNNPKTHLSYTYFDEVNTTKIKVKLSSSFSLDDFKVKFKVLGRSFPLNLRAKLGEEDPFWAAPGEFSKTTSLPPLAETLNRLKSQGNGSGDGIPLTLISDAPGNVTIRINTIDCHLEKVQLQGNETAKVQLKAGKPVKNTLDPISLKSPPIGEPGSQIRLEHIGFDLEGVILSDFGVKVSPVFTAAVNIETPVDLTVQGFKLLLGKDVSPDLELLAEIQTERDGLPCADEVLVSSPIQVDHTTVEQDFWIEVLFEETIQLKTGKKYWLVLKSKTGSTQWKGYLDTDGDNDPEKARPGRLKYSKNAGQTWQDHKVTGFFMLLSDPPRPKNKQILQVGFAFKEELVIGTPQMEEPVLLPVMGPGETVQENGYVYVKEAAQTENPVVLDKVITLDNEGKIDLKLRIIGKQDGFIQLSNAFADYSIVL